MDNSTNHATCPIFYTMNVLSGKWKLLILWYIYTKRVIRYGELKKHVNGISHKMLSKQLSSLEEHGVINKKIYNQIPPKVEYSLSKNGEEIVPILNMMHAYGTKHKNN